MEKQTIKLLNNFWDETNRRVMGRVFLVRVRADHKMLEAQVTVASWLGNVVRVEIVSQESNSQFTDGMLESLREDINQMVKTIFPKCRRVVGKCVFADRSQRLSWFINQ